MKTSHPQVDMTKKTWHVVDAEGKTLGRLASRIASVLRGKHTPLYTPSLDMGDFVVVVNAGKISVTGNKLADKNYYHHSGYPGGIKEISLERLLEKKPEEAIKKAVWGMLPKGVLGRAMFKKLKVYATETHPHSAQNPAPLAD
ncbi:MAG: 50S ribosomal protein L13 [Proteobacteria bacterium]|nr:50S ribosomal protein L13 [Pseudomonadota bacterium]